mmetsp:Transcript_51556/g.122634  ORF Transcript_51556/g.122634 Transcript_51556/m.122634 type:complete len:594 (+) Transcript_51556:81-1862(+)
MAMQVQHHVAAGAVPRMPSSGASTGMLSPVRAAPQRRKSSNGGSLPPSGHCHVATVSRAPSAAPQGGAFQGPLVPAMNHSYEGPSPVRQPSPARNMLVAEPTTARPHYQMPVGGAGSPLPTRNGSAHNLYAASPLASAQSASLLACTGRPSIPSDEAITARQGVPLAMWVAGKPVAPGSYQPPGRAIRQQSGGSIPTSSPGGSTSFRELQNLRDLSLQQRSDNIKPVASVQILTAKEKLKEQENVDVANSKDARSNDLLLEKVENIDKKLDGFFSNKASGKENSADGATDQDIASRLRQELDEVKAQYHKEVSAHEQKQRQLEEMQRRLKYEHKKREEEVDSSHVDASGREQKAVTKEKALELEDKCRLLEVQLSKKTEELSSLEQELSTQRAGQDRQLRDAQNKIDDLTKNLTTARRNLEKSSETSSSDEGLREREQALNALQAKLTAQQAELEREERRLSQEKQEFQNRVQQQQRSERSKSIDRTSAPLEDNEEHNATGATKKKVDDAQVASLKKKVEDQKRELWELETQIRCEQKAAKVATPGEYLKIVKACEEQVAQKNSDLMLQLKDAQAEIQKLRKLVPASALQATA